ncbi:MAG: chitobiase/beta-hexosaminidase C-terminal domain-containing protein, partial [Terracidiphilus sp.]
MFDKNLDLAIGDYISVEVYMPGSGDEGWEKTVSGGGTISTESADLSPETPGKQALLLSAGRPGQSVALSQTLDSLEGQGHIRLNGNFQVTFRAKSAGGNNQLGVNVERLSTGIAPYLNQTVALTNAWQNYTLSFSADETGAALCQMQLRFAAAGANVELDDVSLTQANTSSDNPTAFRDEVVNALKELNPGTIRMAGGSATLGSDIPNQLAAPFARYREGFSPYETTSLDTAYGIHEFLQLCAAVGADPWITIPTATTPQEMTDLIEYLTGTGSDPWSALRIARGQAAPWTSVFEKVHIELGNETWNDSFAGEAMSSRAYSQWANVVFGAARQTNGFEAENFDLILSGSAYSPLDNARMLSFSTQHDSFEIAPYLLLSANNEGQAKLFGALFAEPELFDSPGGEVFQNVQVGVSAHSATEQSTKMNVSESDLSPVRGNIAQAQLNQLMLSAGAGVAQTEHMLQMMRIGAKYQNAFAMAPYQLVRDDGRSVKVMERGVDMGTSERRETHFLTQALANTVIGGDMLQTAQSGANPTWNQPLSSDNVRLNGAHYLQSFAFQKGTSASVIVFNLNQTKSLPVTFSGPRAPVGTVEMTQITSARITDNNESSTQVQPATQTLNSFNPSAALLLPPFSMTLLSWTSNGAEAPTFSVPAGAYRTQQTVTLSSTTPGAAIYYTTDGSVPTTSSSVYSSPIAVSASKTLKAISVAPGFESSPVATAEYDLSTALPALNVTPGVTAAPSIAASLSASASSPAAATELTTEAATTSTPVFNCVSGFLSITSASCGTAFIGAGGPNFAVVGTSAGLIPALLGSAVDLMPSPPGAHAAMSLMYQQAVNVQAFTTTYTFVPDGVNISLVFNNTNNTGSFEGRDFSAGAGCEGGFFQAFGISPNNVLSLELDSGDALTYNGTFTYSGVQVYQSQQDPCTNPYNSDYFT